ncbi:MAG: acyl-CoA dehydrogenase family protein [Steroidobacteraceae bacterium]
MTLVFSDDERLLAESARGFLAERSPVSAARNLRDQHDIDGFSRELWAAVVELGWAGMLVPEEYGGLGFSHAGAGIVCEEAGRVLAASPFFATGVLGATIVREAGSVAQKRQILSAIAAGRLLLAVAVDELARHEPLAITTRAVAHGEGFAITGRKTLVADGHVADVLVIVARTAGEAGVTEGLSLFLVDAGTPGLRVERTVMVDARNSADLRLESVRVPRSALLGELGGGWAPLERTLDVGRVCLAAELLGIARECFARTLDYLRQRKQFGVPIGSFQALQHRAAQLFCEIELCRSVVLRALRAPDEPGVALGALASLAKAKAADTASLAVNESVQMHGGIGMTDALEIGFFMKRVAVARQLFGDGYFHADRLARLSGF